MQDAGESARKAALRITEKFIETDEKKDAGSSLDLASFRKVGEPSTLSLHPLLRRCASECFAASPPFQVSTTVCFLCRRASYSKLQFLDSVAPLGLVTFAASSEDTWDEVKYRSLLAKHMSDLAPVWSPEPAQVRKLAEAYTAAWCSGEPARVASFYSPETGSLSVNDGKPAVGTEAVTGVARSFMTTFPDLQVYMDDLWVQGDQGIYRWTLTGANTGAGGTGKSVRVAGYEVWQIGKDGLIAESRGYYDSAAYARQLQVGCEDPVAVLGLKNEDTHVSLLEYLAFKFTTPLH